MSSFGWEPNSPVFCGVVLSSITSCGCGGDERSFENAVFYNIFWFTMLFKKADNYGIGTRS